MSDNSGTDGTSAQTITGRENRSKGFRTDWAAIAVSVVAFAASVVNIMLYYHLQQQANAISQKNISVEKSIQAQSNAIADRDRAAEVSVVFLTGTNPGMEIRNESPSQIANLRAVFLPDNWPLLPHSTRRPDAILYLYKLSGCSNIFIPESVTLPKNQTVHLPAPDWVSVYFTDPDKNYWVTNSVNGNLSEVNGVRPPNVTYRAAAQDITSEFLPHNSLSPLSSCGS